MDMCDNRYSQARMYEYQFYQWAVANYPSLIEVFGENKIVSRLIFANLSSLELQDVCLGQPVGKYLYLPKHHRRDRREYKQSHGIFDCIENSGSPSSGCGCAPSPSFITSVLIGSNGCQYNGDLSKCSSPMSQITKQQLIHESLQQHKKITF